jgi:hypothetical protein
MGVKESPTLPVQVKDHTDTFLNKLPGVYFPHEVIGPDVRIKKID